MHNGVGSSKQPRERWESSGVATWRAGCCRGVEPALDGGDELWSRGPVEVDVDSEMDGVLGIIRWCLSGGVAWTAVGGTLGEV